VTRARTGATCPQGALVDRHFALRLGVEEERLLRAHLPDCSDCRARYERHLVLARLTPGAPTPEQRLALGLGIRAAGHTARGRAVLLTVAAAAVLALVALPMWRYIRPDLKPDVVTSRGVPTTAEETEVLVFRIDPMGRHTLVEDTIHADDELAMAYRNSARKRRLLVFGTDTNGKVYWYHPGWQDAGSDPAAIQIKATAGLHELPEAVTHSILGDRLTLYAVFLDQRLSVRQVEAMLHRVGLDVPLPIKDAIQRRLQLRVQPPRTRGGSR